MCPHPSQCCSCVDLSVCVCVCLFFMHVFLFVCLFVSHLPVDPCRCAEQPARGPEAEETGGYAAAGRQLSFVIILLFLAHGLHHFPHQPHREPGAGAGTRKTDVCARTHARTHMYIDTGHGTLTHKNQRHKDIFSGTVRHSDIQTFM